MLKVNLRKKFLKIRKKNFDRNIKINYHNFLNLFFKGKKNIVGGYFPVNYEIDCLNILKRLEKKKFRIALPIIKKNNSMEFYQYSFNDPLKINKYGIPEPISKRIINPDYLIVPLVAFDKNLYRLGYGGGYYDRYLEKAKKRKKILSIGFAFSFQKFNRLPIGPFDQKLDVIITERKIYK